MTAVTQPPCKHPINSSICEEEGKKNLVLWFKHHNQRNFSPPSNRTINVTESKQDATMGMSEIAAGIAWLHILHTHDIHGCLFAHDIAGGVPPTRTPPPCNGIKWDKRRRVSRKQEGSVTLRHGGFTEGLQGAPAGTSRQTPRSLFISDSSIQYVHLTVQFWGSKIVHISICLGGLIGKISLLTVRCGDGGQINEHFISLDGMR